MTASDVKRHRQSVARNMEGWAALDFERLSDDLGVEINSEMSPIIVRRVIEGRLAEMSITEHDVVPEETWEYLASIDLLGKFEKLHLKVDRDTLFPMKVKKLGRDVVSLSPVGSTLSSLYTSLLHNPSWLVFSQTTDATVACEATQVVLRSRAFYSWTERALCEVFRGWDKAHTSGLFEEYSR